MIPPRFIARLVLSSSLLDTSCLIVVVVVVVMVSYKKEEKKLGFGGFVNRYTTGIHIIHNDFMLSFAWLSFA